MSKPTIYPLFSTPIYVNNVGDFEKPDVKALEYTTGNYSFLTSTDKRVLERPDFRHVHALIMKEVDLYTRELMRVNASIEFYITDSWINIHRPGNTAIPHVHNNSLVSGVLYLKVSETSGDIVFHRDLLSLVPFPPSLDLDMDAFNLYNCKSWSHRPKVNDICLFPSVVMHSVDANQSSEERWCLAFNLFVRGNIGALHKITIR